MQTKLLIGGMVVVASLLWTSPISAAPNNAKAQNVVRTSKSRYVGIASWYGKQRQGHKMANGERFDRHKLTAASWYFPFGTSLRVVNLKNGESVLVTVTDRGPHQRLRRILDLSEAAAEQLDYIRQGLTAVFLYPMASFETEYAALSSDLIEVLFPHPSAEYEAKALNTPM